MRRYGVTPTGRTWYVALMGALSNENEAAAHQLWDEMEQNDFLPNIHMCSSYMSFCQVRSLDDRVALAAAKLSAHPAEFLQRSTKLFEEKEQDHPPPWVEDLP